MYKALVLIVSLLVILACSLPAAPTAPVQTGSQPSEVVPLETIIALTAGAAQTQTVVAQPTPSPTRFPTFTPIPAPATNTPFSLIAFTPFVPVETTAPEFESAGGSSFTIGGGAGGVSFSGEPWTCVVKSVFPPRGAKVRAGEEFTVTWTVVNNGAKPWTVNTIDFVYRSGFRNEGRGIQDLWRNVPSGGSINLTVLYKAPKTAPKEYRSYWNLRVGNRDFCVMMTEFEVVKP